MRGLKLRKKCLMKWKKVASFTDAWIETSGQLYVASGGGVASFTDAWIETLTELDLEHLAL